MFGHRGVNGVGEQHPADGPLFDSLNGGLAPTESVPVGRINHEHVIPFSELSLKELIGSGAEGKVGVAGSKGHRMSARFLP